MNDSPVTKVICLIAISVVIAVVYQTCYLPATADPIRHVAICGKDEFVVAGSFRRGRVEVWDLALTRKYSVPNECGRGSISSLRASKRLPIVCVKSMVSGGDYVEECLWLEAGQSHRIDFRLDSIEALVDDAVNQVTDVFVKAGGKKSIYRFRDSREFEHITPIPEDRNWIGNGVGYKSVAGEFFWLPHGFAHAAWLIGDDGSTQELNFADAEGKQLVAIEGFLPARNTLIGMRSSPRASESELDRDKCLCECMASDDGGNTWSCTPIESKDVPDVPAWAGIGVGVEHVILMGAGPVRVWRISPDCKVELKTQRDKPL